MVDNNNNNNCTRNQDFQIKENILYVPMIDRSWISWRARATVFDEAMNDVQPHWNCWYNIHSFCKAHAFCCIPSSYVQIFTVSYIANDWSYFLYWNYFSEFVLYSRAQKLKGLQKRAVPIFKLYLKREIYSNLIN